MSSSRGTPAGLPAAPENRTAPDAWALAENYENRTEPSPSPYQPQRRGPPEHSSKDWIGYPSPESIGLRPTYKSDGGAQTDWPQVPAVTLTQARDYVPGGRSNMRQRQALHHLLRQTRERSEERARRREAGDRTRLPDLGPPWLEWQQSVQWQTVRDRDLYEEKERREKSRGKPLPTTVAQILRQRAEEDEDDHGPIVVEKSWRQKWPEEESAELEENVGMKEAIKKAFRNFGRHRGLGPGGILVSRKLPTTGTGTGGRLITPRQPRDFGAAMRRLVRALGIQDQQLPYFVWPLGLLLWFYTFGKSVEV